MSSLDEEKNPFQLWFEEIFKPVQHDDMVALKHLENFLIDIIKEIKSKNDVLYVSYAFFVVKYILKGYTFCSM